MLCSLQEKRNILPAMRAARFVLCALGVYAVLFCLSLALLYSSGLATWDGGGGALDSVASKYSWTFNVACAVLALAAAMLVDRRSKR